MEVAASRSLSAGDRPRSTTSSGALRQAGQEFESILLTSLFSTFQQSFSLEGDIQQDPGHETLTGLANQAICEALTKGGGFGLVASLRRAIEK